MSGEILLGEIHEQPEVLERMLDIESGPVAEIAAALKGRFEYVIIAARGTSDNAARYAQYLLGIRNRTPVGLATPSIFTIYQSPPRLADALVIGISQSGQVPDVISVLEHARGERRPTLAITNDRHSPLAETAEHVIELHAGQEKAVAATKTYTASLAGIAMLSAALGADGDMMHLLRGIPEKMRRVIREASRQLPRVERFRYMEHLAVIGRGFNYASAFEIALKIQELTGIVAEPYSSADFLHGPIAMLRRGFPVFLIAPQGSVSEDMRALAAKLMDTMAELVVISNDDRILALGSLTFALPADLPEWLSPLVSVLPGQLFGLELARAKGLDPDQPDGLSKVTKTW